MKRFSIILGLSCLCLILVMGVAGPMPCAAADTIKIGVPLPLTGRHSPFGQHMKNAFQIALEEINQAGGAKGKKLEFVYADDQSKPETGLTAAQKLISNKEIVMLTGEYSSSITYPMAGLAQKNKVPFVLSTSAADKISQSGWTYIFRVAQPASEFDSGLQEFMKTVVKPKTMVILYENTLFGTSVAKGMKAWAETNGVKVLIFEDYEAGVVDFKPMLFKVKKVNPEVVYAISYLMDATLITRQMKEIDLNPKLFAGSAAGYSIPEYLTGAGQAADYVYTSTMWERTVAYPGAMDFDKKYRAKHDVSPPYHAAQAYATAYVCLDAIKRAKTITRDGIRDALETTDLMTIYGPIKFKSYGKFERQCQLSTLVLQVQKDKFEIVWPKDVSTSEYIFPVPKWSDR